MGFRWLNRVVWRPPHSSIFAEKNLRNSGAPGTGGWKGLIFLHLLNSTRRQLPAEDDVRMVLVAPFDTKRWLLDSRFRGNDPFKKGEFSLSLRRKKSSKPCPIPLWPNACAPKTSTNTSDKSTSWARKASSASSSRRETSLLFILWGPRAWVNHARQDRRLATRTALLYPFGRHFRRQGGPRSDRVGPQTAILRPAPPVPLHRRNPPLQQVAAGFAPRSRRAGNRHADRRHDRKPLLRGDLPRC